MIWHCALADEFALEIGERQSVFKSSMAQFHFGQFDNAARVIRLCTMPCWREICIKKFGSPDLN
jgi:hypothetical protein